MQKIALTADWLPTIGGAEQVVANFCDIWPDAPLYTTVAHPSVYSTFDENRIHTSHLQKWYKLLRTHRVLLPWMPRAMEKIDLTGYDVILSSSHAIGKGIVPPSTAKHICYCHTPMRYAWEMEKEYLKDFHIPKFLQSIVRRQLTALRRWDMTTAKRVDQFIANSTTTQERIQRVYNRDSIVIHPPVEDRFYDAPLQKNDEGTSYYLALGRHVPYKRFDLLMEAANRKKFHLKIGGTGPDTEKLKQMAGPTVEFLGFVESSDVPELYAKAKAFLFPVYEDAGVVPVEAQACGTPVIAYGKGGACDTVKDNITGIFFHEQTCDSLCNAIDQFEKTQFEAEIIREHARQFSATRFQTEIREIVESNMST